jgi:hypothetical protein
MSDSSLHSSSWFTVHNYDELVLLAHMPAKWSNDGKPWQTTIKIVGEYTIWGPTLYRGTAIRFPGEKETWMMPLMKYNEYMDYIKDLHKVIEPVQNDLIVNIKEGTIIMISGSSIPVKLVEGITVKLPENCRIRIPVLTLLVQNRLINEIERSAEVELVPFNEIKKSIPKNPDDNTLIVLIDNDPCPKPQDNITFDDTYLSELKKYYAKMGAIIDIATDKKQKVHGLIMKQLSLLKK